MTRSMVLVSSAALVWLLGVAGPAAAQCDPAGDIEFVCGPVTPEDLVAVPETPWVVVSSMINEGYLYLVNSADHSSAVLYPSAAAGERHDTETYDTCPGASTEGFRPHGLSLRLGENGTHTLYVVRHGGRESVEVFKLDASRATPTITWVGCVVAPVSVDGNSVVPLAEGGFALTNFNRRGDPSALGNLMSGGITGEVWEWDPDGGWRIVPGSEASGANGVEISEDGRWFYIAAWGTQSFMRLSRGQIPVTKETIEIGFNVDNLRWAPDGSLLAAGQGGGTQAVVACISQGSCGGVTTHVAKIDPDTLESEEIIRHLSDGLVTAGTTALRVGDEIWVGQVGPGNRIARFPAP
jgi:hypothetical protein